MINTNINPIGTNNNIDNIIPTLNIATHNVLSLNDPVKQQLLMNFYIHNEANVIALQDIKLPT